WIFVCFFFFQAEDGIRDWSVTGVQTCALPILPFRRLECGPGEEAQVDFGTGAPLVNGDGRRRTQVFRIVLSYSRKAYSEAVSRQIGRASCRERVEGSGGGESVKKKRRRGASAV